MTERLFYLLDTHIGFWIVRGREGRLAPTAAKRFLVATARLKNALIVTRDKRILKYAEQGHVKAMSG